MELPPDHIRALDQLRTRLSQLATSLRLLLDHLQNHNPLPTWPSLQADASTVGVNLAELADVLNSQRQLFSAMHAYPLPNYPGPTQENILQGLLRKKLDPRAEAWIDDSLKSETGGHTSDALLSDEQMEEIWESAKPLSREIIAPMLEEEIFEDDYTIEERAKGVENVVTGIKRIDEEDDGDAMDEDKPSEMPSIPGSDPTKPMEPLQNLLRFATTGDLNPPGPSR
ncbi:Mediator of RNA polymerase II transcription subunit 8 [Lecanosticta acicola]|uniref:Mediator of RNA polymerase II transcription subunit 8 n=1 Tax=Lecanosticta acicola TaxID=111012 RepID=A0AAI8Z361_9PEZI|nr:Mediator of RNA polymerase II transcription subunit 8 [Lecanosticta acicola]